MKKLFLIATLLCFAFVNIYAQVKRDRNAGYGNVLTHYNITLYNAAKINTPSMEFSPMYYRNGIVFVSSRQKNGPVDPKTGETYFDLYYSDLDPNGMPLKPSGFSMEINSPLHEGPVAFNRKQDRMYFTRSNQKEGISKADSKGIVWLKIYEAERGPYDWENIKELPFNSDNFTCMHPALSPDGTKLFFSSNMPGGFGGRDLYMSEKQGGTWSKPVNLGPEINTDKDELFPYLHESGVLFFASDGHPGYGGLDLFMIDLSTRTWGEVTNLGAPFNSAKDDFGLIINPAGTRGYFSSNRDGGAGKDDIYMFEAEGGLQGLNVTPKLTTQLNVYDGSNSHPANEAAIRIFERSGEGLVENDALYSAELVPSVDKPTDFVFKMVRKKEEELGDPQYLTDRTGRAFLQLEAGKNYTILVSKAGFNPQEIKYSLSTGEILKPIDVVLQPNNCFGLSGATLNANNKRHISNVRVRIVNACTNKEDTVMTNIEGTFEYCLDIGCDYTIISEKTGYTQGLSEISTVKIRGSRSAEIELAMTPTSIETASESIGKGSVIILENIYYDFDKSAIRAGADDDLKALAQLMKQYPSMEIELIAHTDSRGTEAYNLALSLRRAESAKEFLVGQGISPDRIRAFGYGESQLRNRCKDGVDCTEEEHQYNRRTEVIITKMDESTEFDFTPRGVPDKKN